MNKFRLLAIVVLILLLALVGSAQAQDDLTTPTPEGTEIVIIVEATETPTVAESTVEATQDTGVTIVIEQPPSDEPTTTVNNNGFSFEQVALSFFAFILSIFVGIRMFVVPVLKANHELAVKAGELVPQASFDKMIGITEGLQRIAEVVTPNFTGDDEGLKRLRGEIADLKLLLFPEAPPVEPPPDGTALG